MGFEAICTTSVGTFTLTLFADQMPITVGNFVALARGGFYNGMTFHRVIPNFMAQFGCPHSKDPSSRRAGTGGPDGNTSYDLLDGSRTITRDRGGNIPDEFTARLGNDRGTVSMANTGQPNSGGSQFFINVANNNFLDWFDRSTPSKHPVFGQCKTDADIDVIDSIVSVPRNSSDKPNTPIYMESIEIVET